MFLRISQNSKESTCARVSFLTLKARTVFQNFEKIQAISLYWFTAQQQTSRLTRQKIGLFYVNIHAEFSELSIFFLKQQEVAKKYQKMVFFQWKPFFLVEDIPFNGNHSLQQVIAFNGRRSFQWKPFLLVEAISFSGNYFPFSGNRSVQWKPFLLEEAISFSGNHSFQCKPFRSMESIPFSGSRFFQWETFLLVEAIPFSGNHSLYEK